MDGITIMYCDACNYNKKTDQNELNLIFMRAVNKLARLILRVWKAYCILGQVILIFRS
jgi:hypothetical protein